jgi:hypothetical protein
MTLLGILSRGKLHYHFSTEEEAEKAFLTLNFNKTLIYKPEYFYHRLPIPRSRLLSFVQIIEAFSEKSA